MATCSVHSQTLMGRQLSLQSSRPVITLKHSPRRGLQCNMLQRPNSGPPRTSLQSVRQVCDSFLQRYDVLSTGVGALCVTSYCVWRGQSPAEALGITAAATLAGLVLNELLEERG